MKELILWREVDANEVPEKWEGDEYILMYNHNSRYLKRVVIPILSDQEIWAMSEKDKWQRIGGLWGSDIEKCDKSAFENGYKAMQERLIGGNI